MNYTEAEELLKKYGQLQLLQYFDELDGEKKEELLNGIGKVDFSVLENLGHGAERKIGELSPANALSVEDIEKNRAEYEEAGIKALKENKVAAVLLAGGQGTRLGSDLPKGAFDIGVTRPLSIFGQQMKNIEEVTEKTGKPFYIFVMTSEKNDAYTRSFFEENGYFGYDKDKIRFFVQDTAPACSYDGKVFLEEKHKVCTSPNGNGGWYSSLLKADYGKILKDEGIEWLNIYSVDNVLQRICDPVFVGATLKSGCACSGKVVKKTCAEEKVGVLCKEDGLPTIIEYTEMPKELSSLRGADGELTFRYGVTLNYLFNVAVLDDICKKKLPYHLANKKIPHIENGVKVFPEQPNGYKFETLVVDMIKMTGSCLAVEVVREKEFAPVKNKTGVDSVESARRLLEKNGVKL